MSPNRTLLGVEMEPLTGGGHIGEDASLGFYVESTRCHVPNPETGSSRRGWQAVLTVYVGGKLRGDENVVVRHRALTRTAAERGLIRKVTFAAHWFGVVRGRIKP